MILFSLITLNYTHIAYIIIEFNYFEKRERERRKERFRNFGGLKEIGKGNFGKWE